MASQCVESPCVAAQAFRSGLRTAVHALDEPQAANMLANTRAEVQTAILVQKHSWHIHRKAVLRGNVMQFLQANLQQPLEHVVQAQRDMLVPAHLLNLITRMHAQRVMEGTHATLQHSCKCITIF